MTPPPVLAYVRTRTLDDRFEGFCCDAHDPWVGLATPDPATAEMDLADHKRRAHRSGERAQ